MYLALLFDEGDQLLAAAPACDQQPLGNRYWREVYPQSISGAWGETAIIDIGDRSLSELLLSLAVDSSVLPECRARFAAYEKSHGPVLPSRRAQAA